MTHVIIPAAGLLLSLVIAITVMIAYTVLKKLYKDWEDKIEWQQPYLPNPAGAGTKGLVGCCCP
jgi:hypothetical protein